MIALSDATEIANKVFAEVLWSFKCGQVPLDHLHLGLLFRFQFQYGLVITFESCISLPPEFSPNDVYVTSAILFVANKYFWFPVAEIRRFHFDLDQLCLIQCDHLVNFNALFVNVFIFKYLLVVQPFGSR